MDEWRPVATVRCVSWLRRLPYSSHVKASCSSCSSMSFGDQVTAPPPVSLSPCSQLAFICILHSRFHSTTSLTGPYVPKLLTHTPFLNNCNNESDFPLSVLVSQAPVTRPTYSTIIDRLSTRSIVGAQSIQVQEKEREENERCFTCISQTTPLFEQDSNTLSIDVSFNLLVPSTSHSLQITVFPFAYTHLLLQHRNSSIRLTGDQRRAAHMV